MGRFILLTWLVVGCWGMQAQGEKLAPQLDKAAAPGVVKTGVKLSFVDWQGDTWTWMKLDIPSKKLVSLAHGMAPLDPAKTSLSPARSRGLLHVEKFSGIGKWYDSDSSPPGVPDKIGHGSQNDQLFLVDFKTGRVKEFFLPSTDMSWIEIRFDDKGRILALGMRAAEEHHDSQGHFLLLDGKRLPSDNLRNPVLVMADEWRQGRWITIEAIASDSGTEGTLGVERLSVWKHLLTDSATGFDPRDSVEMNDSATLNWLKRRFNLPPRDLFSSWFRLKQAPEVVYWAWPGETSINPSGWMLFVKDGVPYLPENWPFTDGDAVAYIAYRGYLLAAQQWSGAHPRLYDLRTRRCIWASDTAQAATFWDLTSRIRRSYAGN